MNLNVFKESLVLYTDGGCRYKVGGMGVHGYIYNDDISKTFHGHNNYVATKDGYQLKINKTIPVNVLNYLDFISSCLDSTNNIAELGALINALKYVYDNNFKDALFILDSEYALKGATEWVAQWKQANWKRNGSEPVLNSTHWMQIDELIVNIENKGTKLRWKWIKGHSGELGNTTADKLATKAINAHFKLVDRGTYTSEGMELKEGRYVISNPKNYWTIKTDFNKLLNMPRLLLNAYIKGTVDDLPPPPYNIRYFMIDIRDKDDGLIGKPVSTATYAILYLSEPDIVVERLFLEYKETVNYLSKKYPIILSPMLLLRMNEVLSPSTYREIKEEGTLYLKNSIDRADISDYMGNILAYEIRPTGLAYDAQSVFLENHLILNNFLKSVNDSFEFIVDTTTFAYTDIFNILYDVNQNTKNKTIKLKNSVVDDNCLDLNVKFKSLKGVIEVPLRIIIGMETPRKSVLSGISDNIIAIGMVTWNDSIFKDILRYALIVKTNKDLMFLVAHYSNIKIV